MTNKVEDFSIDEGLVITEIGIDKRCIDIVPNVKVNKLHVEQLEDVILKAKNNKNYVRIKYKDKNGNVTIRTIESFDTIPHDGSNYLVGKCLLRNDIRNFVIHKDKIHFLEVLNLNYQ